MYRNRIMTFLFRYAHTFKIRISRIFFGGGFEKYETVAHFLSSPQEKITE